MSKLSQKEREFDRSIWLLFYWTGSIAVDMRSSSLLLALALGSPNLKCCYFVPFCLRKKCPRSRGEGTAAPEAIRGHDARNAILVEGAPIPDLKEKGNGSPRTLPPSDLPSHCSMLQCFFPFALFIPCFGWFFSRSWSCTHLSVEL